MSGAGSWSDASWSSEMQAFGDGEYDGYWGVPLRDGAYDNPVWLAYLKGYTAGVKDRSTEPSDAQIDSFIRNVNEALMEEDR